VFTFILLAPLSRLYDEGKINEVTTHLSYSLKYYLVLAIPFCFGSMVLAGPVLKIISTPEIANQGNTITPIIALSVTLLGITNIVSNILVLVKKTKISAYIWIFVAILNVGFNFVLVPRIGISGAAITTLMAYILALFLTVFYSIKEFRFSVNWYFIGKSLAASAVMSVFTWFMYYQWGFDTILTVAVGVVVYAVILILLRGFSKEEFKFFISILPHRQSF
jgi:O-antigen/teichoic acid export membrane protein